MLGLEIIGLTHVIHKKEIHKSSAKLVHLVSLFKEGELSRITICYK